MGFGNCKMDKHEILEDIVHEAPNGANFMEWLIENSTMPKREILQHYMIWKFKYDQHIKDDNGACIAYVDQGYAKKFADEYDGRCSAHTLYQRVFKK